jgi:hypothetical protein
MTTAPGGTDLDHVVDKLVERYPEHSRERLRDEVEKAHRHFSGAKVQDFLPVLIERRVRARLQEAAGR